jgi:hypothetical protein
MRIELASGNWIEVRDKLKARDRQETQNAVSISFDESGNRQLKAGIQDVMRNALLTQIITGWSYEGIPIPSIWGGADAILDTVDLDDYNTLAEAVQPLLEKVSFTATSEDKGPNQGKPSKN